MENVLVLIFYVAGFAFVIALALNVVLLKWWINGICRWKKEEREKKEMYYVITENLLEMILRVAIYAFAIGIVLLIILKIFYFN